MLSLVVQSGLLPFAGPQEPRMRNASVPNATSVLDIYCAEMGRYPLLSVPEEQSLARAYRRKGDTRAAHKLITANLRFVVKIASEYRSYGFNKSDLIQEGNMGLVRAVQKFDPDMGIRFISYAVWWIRAYVQNFILRCYSLVKLGTTQAQRKLFFALARTRRELDRMSSGHGADSDGANSSKVAARLNVKPAEVEEMSQRMLERDLSLDAPMGEDGSSPHIDFVAGTLPPADDVASTAQEQVKTHNRVAEAIARLDERERYIIEQRLMRDEPATLREIGRHFNFSRERARQLESRAKEKLKRELHGLAVEIDWPIAAA